jgi:hypothetical protein
MGWAKENLTTEEINSKLLFVADNEGKTVLHMVTERGYSERLQKLK